MNQTNQDIRQRLAGQIRAVAPSSFEKAALAVFRYQAEHNELYREYLRLLRVNTDMVKKLEEVPFLPISFFKTHTVKTGQWEAKRTFTSSGTTGQTSSRHLLRQTDWYHQQAQRCFSHFYGAVSRYCYLALLPSYLERQGSSLIDMAAHFMSKSPYVQSGFFLDDFGALTEQLAHCRHDNTPTILLGVSFALLDFAEQCPQDLSWAIIMETGGMKGRRQEITRSQLHNTLKAAFQSSAIHSEYGMTELLSQAYSQGNGRFGCPPTLRLLVREPTDPFSLRPAGKTGVLNVVDLANLDTCAFIATDDLGRCYEDGSFEVLGRLDHSELRGCNLMVF